MRILGLEIRRAGGPQLRAAYTDFDARSRAAAVAAYRAEADGLPLRQPTVQAVGELPTDLYYRSGRRFAASGPRSSLSQRAVPSDPMADFWLQMPPKVEPKQIEAILRGCLAGNLWQFAQLTSRMLTSWPMYRKCLHELRSVVASAKYSVHPYNPGDGDPTPGAEERADCVRRSLNGFRPDRFKDEDGRSGMVYDLTDALPNGAAMVELLWDTKSVDPDGNREARVRASAYVNPRHLAFSPDGSLGVSLVGPDAYLSFPAQGGVTSAGLLRDPRRFLVAKYKSKSGSPLSYGYTHVLGYYWTMLMYGRDFLAAFAQKYGNPFLDLEYAGDQDSQSLRERFEWMAKRAANQGYAVHPVGTKINVVPAQSMGSQNPTGEMMRTANEACQLLVLGQTLTTQVGDSGSRALGDVHMDVRDEKRQEVCKWVAGILTEQFVPTVLAENYGDAEECPTVEPDFAKPLTAQEKATLLTAVSSSRLPLPCEPLYRLLEMEKPEPGDQAVVGGEVVVVEEATTATDKRRQQMAEQLDFAAAAGGMEAQRQEQVQASWPVRVKSLAVKASREELLGVRKILARCQAASRTGRLNGEAAELEAAVKAIEQRNRP